MELNKIMQKNINLSLNQGGRTGGGWGDYSPTFFWDLFSKFWEFFENPLFAIYYSPPHKKFASAHTAELALITKKVSKSFDLSEFFFMHWTKAIMALIGLSSFQRI